MKLPKLGYKLSQGYECIHIHIKRYVLYQKICYFNVISESYYQKEEKD